MKHDSAKNGLAQHFATSSLVQAQSLEILFHNLNFDVHNQETFMRIGSVFEDIGNIYLNLSEHISIAYAQVDEGILPGDELAGLCHCANRNA